MLSLLSSLPSFVLDLLSSHLELVLGYAICVLFPIPWLNAFIIDVWAKLLKKAPPAA